jgi:hypothetical protein
MFLPTLLVGVAAVVATATAPLYVDRTRIPRSPLLGVALVFAAVGLGVGTATRSLPARPELALAAFPLLLVGALLLVAPEAGGDDPPRADGDPPWWPEFEDAFRRYTSTPRLPLARR